MKGKAIFTKEEAERIEALIKQKCAAEPSKQKGIRQKIRNLGFYAKDDFGISGGYTVADFRRVVRIVDALNDGEVQNVEITSIDLTNNSDDTPEIDFGSGMIHSLKMYGFKGFISIQSLIDEISIIPNEKGVYMIYYENLEPQFVTSGTGGFFKEKDPNVSIEILQQNWVENTPILYIGKAGSIEGSATLQFRLKQYFQFGHGKKVGHWGGRFIWQISYPDQLKVCWLPTPNHDPREVEKLLIAEFVTQFNQRPFANLKD